MVPEWPTDGSSHTPPPLSSFSGGTVKAEDVKLQGAGISPKQCPRKCAPEKGVVTGLSEIGARSRSALRARYIVERKKAAEQQQVTVEKKDSVLASAF